MRVGGRGRLSRPGPPARGQAGSPSSGSVLGRRSVRAASWPMPPVDRRSVAAFVAARAPGPAMTRSSASGELDHERAHLRVLGPGRVRDVGRPEDGLAGGDPGPLLADADPAAALDDDEPGRVRVGRAARSGASRAKASSATTPRPSEWMTWPVRPCEPGGPSGRRWPTPNRRISIGIGELAARRRRRCALAGDGRRACGSSPRGRRTSAWWSSAAGEPRLVRREERREPQEPDPDQRPEADDLDREDEEEVEHEQRLDDHQAERDQPGPPQPLPHVEVGRVLVEGPRPDDVQDDEHDQQDERRDPRRSGTGPGSCRG